MRQAFDRLARRRHVVRHRPGDRGGILGIGARHQAEQQRAILGGARQRPDGVERLRQRHRAGAADPAIGGLQSGDAAEMRGHPDRAAGVRAQRRKGQPRRDRRARSRRRAAGDVIDSPGIMHRAVMGVVAGRAVGELHHLQRAQPNRAGILQALQRGRGRGRDEIAADLRAAGHHLAGVVIHVLVRQRHAVQRAAAVALGQRRIGGIGRLQRRFGFDRHEGIETRLPLRDPVEAGLRHLARGDALVARSPSRPRSATSGPARCSFRNLRGSAPDRKVAGSRSNGSVPAIGAKPSKAGPIELAMRVGDLGADGHARDVGHRLDLLRSRSCHAVSAPFAGARLWPEPGIAI